MLGPLAAYLPTPRTADGGVAPGVLAALADRAVAAGADAVAVLGSTGGFAYLNGGDRARVARAAVEAVDGRVPVVCGIGALTTADVLGHAAAARAAGVDAVLLPPMSYLPLTAAEALALYRDVAALAEVPVWIYHNPRTTGLELTVDDLLAIAALPGVGGLKDRGLDVDDVRTRCAALLTGVPAHVEVGFSGDALGSQALLAGARTWHSGLAGVLPGPWVATAAAATAGDAALVDTWTERLAPLTTLGARWGAMRLAGPLARHVGLDLGPLPAPLLDVPAEVRADLDAAVERALA
ncbi:dihydrodipicolinate synthase family protein [Cellulomonas sp. H30R-01]|uniref:dihydrodipicolinate synthase family protein n=1 Tax=Cellulomonas sp. H30R-01 TaxID=2704467 RepID=UPI00138D6BF0|nr:dihydrodipicolinate synthase family protein [Cellulomonas sp. H30R-01]QHT55596.1 dihydrodipicolinate synthase family protein [Cellulomonas sp. H30R-01]